ncbi:hypothetical protein [Rhodanobacter sp. C01]|uniref:hypothetical protein n=1 Tax=Rhodanobacter sp. C01 TaxID=1945856 RepID=UPI000984F069|nr:hypothetical protein [Rhodanobacter sp. C01]OOG45630.1 hypothetical protein B0E50_15675 [Rhodanobacter sp. C01]
MTEIEFIREMDCRFPYEDWEKCLSLMELGASISANSAFMVLHEICRPPRSKKIKVHLLKALLDAWQERFTHPLVQVVLPAAEALMHRKTISVIDALNTMRSVARYQDQYNALALPYFASDDDVDETVEALYKETILRWQTPNNSFKADASGAA